VIVKRRAAIRSWRAMTLSAISLSWYSVVDVRVDVLKVRER
jgi:hypothetical protein